MEMNHEISDERKAEIIMVYLNESSHKIPSNKNDIRFCDIDNSCTYTGKVGVYLQNHINFQRNYSHLKEMYPIAYERLEYRFNDKKFGIIFHKRIELIVLFLNSYHLTSSDRFCDIGGSSFDAINVMNWYSNNLKMNEKIVFDRIKEVCIAYHFDYQTIINKLSHSNDGRKKISFKEATRMKVFMNYLEQNKFPNLDLRVTFHDLDSGVDDSVDVLFWFRNNITKYGELFLEEFASFKDIYPNGYKRILQRKVLFFNRKNLLVIPRNVKLELVMKYLEISSDLWVNNQLTFYDLDHSIDSHSLVKNWFYNEFAGDLSLFMQEVENYREIYPKAYLKIVNKINNSQTRLRKERLLLLSQLKNIRNQISQQNDFSMKKIMKI